MGLITITPPATEPVTLAEVKEYLRLDGNEHDNILSALISSARMYCEAFQNRLFAPQTLEYTQDKWTFPIYLPKPPCISVSSFSYIDENDDVFYFNDYAVEMTPNYTKIVQKRNMALPTIALREVAGIRIRYTTGYETIPSHIKLAILLFIGHRFENPEVESVPAAVHHLLWPDRVVPV